LQGADLTDAWLQGANLWAARLQCADLFGAHLQGSDLSGAQLQGADLRGADFADSDLDGTFVFRTNIANADLSTAAIHSVRAEADQVKEEIDALRPPDVDAATQFAAETEKEKIEGRFARLKVDPGFQTPTQDASDVAKWVELTKQSLAAEPDGGARHRQRLAALLADVACGAEGAPYVARAFIKPDFFEGKPRLPALGDQFASVRARMEEGRKTSEKCPGVVGFTEYDWRKLDAIKPTQTAPADH
jgi:hypothetical protein